MGMINNLPDNIKFYIENDKSPLVNGYVRFLDSDEMEVIAAILQNSSMWNKGTPFATTVFGDIISWEDGYVMLYKFTEEDYTVILSGTGFFFQNMCDKEYQKDYFDVELYEIAKTKLGTVDSHQCYVLEPIPKLGGARDIKYMNIGDMNSYLQMII